MPLPVNVDSSYPDRSAADTAHQQHHDTIHAAVNEVNEGRLTAASLDGKYKVPVGKAKRTTALSINTGGAWADVDTALDVIIAAAAGDRIEVSVAARAIAPGGTTYGVLDFHTVVAGAPVNSVAADGAIVITVSQPGWAYGQITSTAYSYFLGAKTYVVAAGDLDGGNVRLRLRARTGAAVSFDGANDPYMYVQAVNYRQ